MRDTSSIIVITAILLRGYDACSTNQIVPSSQHQKCVEDFDGYAGLGSNLIYDPNLRGLCVKWEWVPGADIETCHNLCWTAFQGQACGVDHQNCKCTTSLSPTQQYHRDVCNTLLREYLYGGWSWNIYPSPNSPIRFALWDC